jgi:hypothetical protein
VLLEFELKLDLDRFFCFLQSKYELKKKDLVIGMALAYLEEEVF